MECPSFTTRTIFGMSLVMLMVPEVVHGRPPVPSDNVLTPYNVDGDGHGPRDVNRLLRILQQSGLENQRAMKRVFLSDRSVTCNDGSPAAYYIRRSPGSKKWIVFLEGGWYCYSEWTCRQRWGRLRDMMSSKGWPETKNLNGILSPDPQENPYWWNANHVFLPYCSSDCWSGSRTVPSMASRFVFMGSLILQQAVRDLVREGLNNGSELILAGSSAGGTGVMLNVDAVAALVHSELGLRDVAVRGIADSGWFLDREPYDHDARASASPRVHAADGVRVGLRVWRGRVPPACAFSERRRPWMCYFGFKLYPTIRAPLFIFQWLFDEAQMTADNVGAPVTKDQWDFIHKMGDNFRNTFKNVSAVFAPACIAHTVLTNRDWTDVRVHDVSLPKALRCWELRTASEAGAAAAAAAADMATPLRPRIGLIGIPGAEDDDDEASAYASPAAVHREVDPMEGVPRHRNSSISMLSDSAAPLPLPISLSLPHLPPHLLSSVSEPPPSGRRHGRRRKNRPRGKDRPRGKKNKKNRKGKGKGERREARNSNRQRPQRSASAGNQRTVTPTSVVVPDEDCDHCDMRHVEQCSWPQCNHSCPRLHNPITGEVMDFIELLKSFGLDMSSVANALGIDIHTLNNMDHEELLNLLTQQAS